MNWSSWFRSGALGGAAARSSECWGQRRSGPRGRSRRDHAGRVVQHGAAGAAKRGRCDGPKGVLSGGGALRGRAEPEPPGVGRTVFVTALAAVYSNAPWNAGPMAGRARHRLLRPRSGQGLLENIEVVLTADQTGWRAAWFQLVRLDSRPAELWLRRVPSFGASPRARASPLLQLRPGATEAPGLSRAK